MIKHLQSTNKKQYKRNFYLDLGSNMTLGKQSQLDYDGFSLPTDELFDDDQGTWSQEPKPSRPYNPGDYLPDPLPVMPPEPQRQPVNPDDFLGHDLEDLDSGSDSNSADELVVSIDDGSEDGLTFTLPLVPGGLDQSELEEPAEIELEEDDNISVEEASPWSWQTSNFLQWLASMMQNVPPHSGKDSAGIERAISYLEAIDREISKAVRSDLNNEIDTSAVEKARDELYKGLVRLKERLDKVMISKYPSKSKGKKKKANLNSDLVKEATKATHVGGIIVTVPLIISHVARTCINSMVSAGKDIEDCFDKLAKKYKFSSREEAETMQLLADMGYPMRRPRGYDRDEEIDFTSTDNHDWMANYPA